MTIHYGFCNMISAEFVLTIIQDISSKNDKVLCTQSIYSSVCHNWGKKDGEVVGWFENRMYKSNFLLSMPSKIKGPFHSSPSLSYGSFHHDCCSHQSFMKMTSWKLKSKKQKQKSVKTESWTFNSLHFSECRRRLCGTFLWPGAWEDAL